MLLLALKRVATGAVFAGYAFLLAVHANLVERATRTRVVVIAAICYIAGDVGVVFLV